MNNYLLKSLLAASPDDNDSETDSGQLGNRRRRRHQWDSNL